MVAVDIGASYFGSSI